MTVLRLCATTLLMSVSSGVLAADWVVDRARGQVLQWEQGRWAPLERGDAVPDARKIRTGADGRADLVRGGERISLAPNTEIAIRDAGDAKMTSVLQSFGSVSIEAERRNVQHFSVQTPVLAAVVKGTQFRVTYANGRAQVLVDRGVVQVQDTVHDMVADVQRGQSADVGERLPLDVSGPGSDRTVYLVEGQAVTAQQRDILVSGGSLPESTSETLPAPAGGLPPDAAGGRSEDRGSSSNSSASAHAGVGKGNEGVSVGAGAGNGNGLSLGVGNGNGTGNSNGNGNALGLGNGNGNGLSLGVGNGNANGDGNGLGLGVGNGNGNSAGGGLGLGLGNGNGNGVSVGAGDGGTSRVNVDTGPVGANVGTDGGVSVNVDAGGVNVGVGSGSGSSGNSGNGNSGNGNGNGNSGNSGSGSGSSGLGVSVDTGLGIGLRL